MWILWEFVILESLSDSYTQTTVPSLLLQIKREHNIIFALPLLHNNSFSEAEKLITVQKHFNTLPPFLIQDLTE